MIGAAKHYLMLHAVDPAWAPDLLAAFAEQLGQAGLTGTNHRLGLFSTGPSYLEWIMYLGCSPLVSLGEADNATRIRLVGPFDKPELLTAANARPRCRSCRQTLDLVKKPGWANEAVECPHCKTSSSPAKLDWRRKGGFARFFIQISNVYDAEAVPSDRLLETLEHLTGQAWDYFYWRDG